MSRPLVYLVATSRHPLLMDDPTARDVLVCMADLAQDRNGGRIVASVGSLAEACQRGSAAVRHARDRLIEAGFLVEIGAGTVSKRAAEYRIREETLHAVCTKNTLGPSARNQRESAASLLPSDCPPIAAGLPSDCLPIAAGLPSTRARLEQEQEPKLELEQEPDLPTESGSAAERKRTPGEARLAAAVDEVMGIIAPKGQTPATLDTWRNRLKNRLGAKGVAADAVEDRLRAVKAAWHFVSTNGWHAEQGRNGPAHFFTVTLRNDENVDRDAVRQPVPSGQSTAPVRRTRGGVELGPPRFEFDTNPDGSVRW